MVNVDEIYKQALEVAEKKKLIFVEEIVNYLPLCKTTFYEKFPVDSNEMNEIKKIIDRNKIDIKVSQRQKWYMSDHPSLQIALYKLCANGDELGRLNNRDHDEGGKVMDAPIINIEEKRD